MEGWGSASSRLWGLCFSDRQCRWNKHNAPRAARQAKGQLATTHNCVTGWEAEIKGAGFRMDKSVAGLSGGSNFMARI